MYKTIITILKTSKEHKVDVGVAENILQASEKSRKILDDYYKPITTFYRENKLELIKELCDLVENDNTDGVKEFLDKYKDFINESFNKASR